MSNTKFNGYLKEIADVVGIEFNLTHHLARKTFSSTVLYAVFSHFNISSVDEGRNNICLNPTDAC